MAHAPACLEHRSEEATIGGEVLHDATIERELEERVRLVTAAEDLTEPLDARDYLMLLLVTLALPLAMLFVGWWL